MAAAALFTRMSTCPRPSIASGTMRARSSLSLKSVPMTMHFEPSPRIRSAVSFRLPEILSPGSTLRATIATSAPSDANWIATALPMPRLAPVTIADRPANRCINAGHPISGFCISHLVRRRTDQPVVQGLSLPSAPTVYSGASRAEHERRIYRNWVKQRQSCPQPCASVFSK